MDPNGIRFLSFHSSFGGILNSTLLQIRLRPILEKDADFPLYFYDNKDFNECSGMVLNFIDRCSGLGCDRRRLEEHGSQIFGVGVRGTILSLRSGNHRISILSARILLESFADYLPEQTEKQTSLRA